MINRKKKKELGYFEQTRQFIFLVLVVFLIRTFGFGLYQVPTGSMETTMLVGERFFADKFTYIFSKPQRGDIISFNDPLFDYSDNKIKRLFQEYVWGPSNWTKRLIGLPGDVVEGKIEDNKPVIYINGQKIDQPFVNKYPLVGLWKVDPTQFNRIVEKEIVQLMSQGRLDATLIPRYKEHRLGSLIEWRSYDPSVSYKDQPFYRVTPDRLYPNSQNPDMKLPGTPLTGAYVKVPEGKNFWNGTDEFYVKLGENQYWAMGDNRLGSQDSRFFGPLDARLIHGKIIFRIWSLDMPSDVMLFPSNMFEKVYSFFADWWIVDLIKHPIDFWSRVRWSRFFQVIK